ncbi:MAG: hydrogenase maturation nickel metallochaperone HypA [Gammaproteobacteria bacterium]|nr:hydrogenase maturation nickel metallochaperone HypA [Gammaproteobacteria bacterium]
MHELQVTEQILEIALKHVEGQDVSRIVNIHLRIGDLTDLEGEWIQHYFDYLSKGTLAENAKLEIEQVPIVLACEDCGAHFKVTKHELGEAKCPECQDDEPNFRMISGREYTVMNLEVV